MESKLLSTYCHYRSDCTFARDCPNKFPFRWPPVKHHLGEEIQKSTSGFLYLYDSNVFLPCLHLHFFPQSFVASGIEVVVAFLIKYDQTLVNHLAHSFVTL